MKSLNPETRELVEVEPARMVGHLVRYWLGGTLVFWGLAEYLTADGWFGIRQPGGCLDEAPADKCDLDPT